MKKITAILLALALTLSLGIMAFAEDKTQSLEVSYTTSESYTVTIPSSQAVTTATQTGTVSATKVLLEDGKKLVVSVASANGYKLVFNDSKIAYTMKAGDTTLSGTAAQDILSVTSGTTTGSKTLSFYTTDAAIKAATVAGTHSDTLTFTCAVKTA